MVAGVYERRETMKRDKELMRQLLLQTKRKLEANYCVLRVNSASFNLGLTR